MRDWFHFKDEEVKRLRKGKKGESMDRVRSSLDAKEGERVIENRQGRWGGNKRYKKRGESMDRVRCEVRGGDNEWAG